MESILVNMFSLNLQHLTNTTWHLKEVCCDKCFLFFRKNVTAENRHSCFEDVFLDLVLVPIYGELYNYRYINIFLELRILTKNYSAFIK